MINLINLLNTAIISASMGANLNMMPNRQEMNRSNNSAVQDYWFQMTLQNANEVSTNKTVSETFTYSSTQTYTASKTIADYRQRYNYTEIKPMMSVRANMISQRPYWQSGNTRYGLYRNQTTEGNQTLYNQILLKMQIDPSWANLNNRVVLNISVDIDNQIGTLTGTNKFYVETIVTTDNLSQFIDQTSWYSNTCQEEVNLIKSPQYGYRYELYNQEQNMIFDENNQIRQEFTINPNTRNYVIVSIVPQVNIIFEDTQNTAYYDLICPSYYTQVESTGYSSGTRPNYNAIEMAGTYMIIDGNQEIIDLPGLMYDILVMPFTFVSLAFNLTIFPGTPYQINISNLFLSLFGIVVLIALIKILLNFKDIG